MNTSQSARIEYQIVAIHWINFATIRMGLIGRGDALCLRAVLHHRPTKPDITLHIARSALQCSGASHRSLRVAACKRAALLSKPASETAERVPLRSLSGVQRSLVFHLCLAYLYGPLFCHEIFQFCRFASSSGTKHSIMVDVCRLNH